MLRKRAISKAIPFERPMFLDHVHDPAGIQRPKPEMRNKDCNSGANLDGRIRPTQANPRHIKHLPLLDRDLRPFKALKAPAQFDAVAVSDITPRCLFPRTSNFRIGEWLSFLSRDKSTNEVSTRPCQMEHAPPSAPKFQHWQYAGTANMGPAPDCRFCQRGFARRRASR